MVALVTLDHSVWVRVLVPEPWRYGQEAKTSPSQGEIKGSIPFSATNEENAEIQMNFSVYFFTVLFY